MLENSRQSRYNGHTLQNRKEKTAIAANNMEDKNMKKLLALLLALTMVFALAACGGGDKAADEAPADDAADAPAEEESEEAHTQAASFDSMKLDNPRAFLYERGTWQSGV